MRHDLVNKLYLIVSLIVGVISGEYWEVPQEPTVQLFFLVSALSCSAIVVMCLIADGIAPNDERWLQPNLSSPSSEITQPLQGFWMSALCFAMLGIGNMSGSWFSSRDNNGWVILLAVSLGSWLGVHLSARIFRLRVSVQSGSP